VSTLLLDSGVWLAARDADDPFHEPAKVLVGPRAPARAAALDLTLYEVGNVATVRWRSPAEAALLIDLILSASEDRLVRADAGLVGEAVSVAAAAGLSVYDAAYVACAQTRAWQLISTDLADLVEPGLAWSPAEAVA
jgi:predicted nucleic acid-binding protein